MHSPRSTRSADVDTGPRAIAATAPRVVASAAALGAALALGLMFAFSADPTQAQSDGRNATPNDEAETYEPPFDQDEPSFEEESALDEEFDAPQADGPEGAFTLVRMDELIRAVDPEAETTGTSWRFTVEEAEVLVVTSPTMNRMRMMVRIRPLDGIAPSELIRLLQANFDTALDARYAIAQGQLWSTYIHPLSSLHDRQFLEGLGQTVNLAKTYGETYSSGLLLFRGGDSGEQIARDLIDRLLEQGEDI